jgi:hypothetical protein
MGITEIMRRIWLFPVNKIKSSESFSKQLNSTHHRTQLIIAAHNCYTSLVQIASVRRSLFNNAERGKFLNQLVAGVREILQNPSGINNTVRWAKILQTKMLVTCQRFGDLFLFGLVWQYSSVQKKYNKGGFKADVGQ